MDKQNALPLLRTALDEYVLPGMRFELDRFLFIIPWLMSVQVCAYMMLSGQFLVSKMPQKGGDSLSGEAIAKKQ